MMESGHKQIEEGDDRSLNNNNTSIKTPPTKDDGDNRRETSSNSEKYDSEDYKARLLDETHSSVYNECTAPLYDDNKRQLFNKAQLPACLSHVDSNSPNPIADSNGGGAFTMVDLGNRGRGSAFESEGHEDEGDEHGSAQVRFIKKSSVHGDMIQSINNLRLNVNNHIIGGSKNVMGRMRKISINELNRHGSSTGRKYKVAFYAALALVSLLFLYLIYQNLFIDR